MGLGDGWEVWWSLGEFNRYGWGRGLRGNMLVKLMGIVG